MRSKQLSRKVQSELHLNQRNPRFRAGPKLQWQIVEERAQSTLELKRNMFASPLMRSSSPKFHLDDESRPTSGLAESCELPLETMEISSS